MLTKKSTLNTITRGMFRRALAASAMQLGIKTPARAAEELRKGDCDRCQVFRINLARQVGSYLSTVDSDLRAVYAYNPDYAFGDYQSTGSKSSFSSALYLLAWTRTRKSIPSDVTAKLSRAFLTARQMIKCGDASETCINLTLQIVTDAQVKARQGYAALIESLNVRPNQVWVKEHASNRRQSSAQIKMLH
jgi:hypothetical protein